MKAQLAPSILSFDLGKLEPSLKVLATAGSDVIHLDVMDGQFVPPITFGSAFVHSIRQMVETPFEAHLMTQTPERQFDAFHAAGCSRIIFHVEATPHAHRLCQSLREMGVEAGVAINPQTPVELVQPLYDVVDLVLVMTVNPGWGGQKFIGSALEKVKRIRQERPELAIEVDGGINNETLPIAREAGANVFVVGNHLASARSLEEATRRLKALCD